MPNDKLKKNHTEDFVAAAAMPVGNYAFCYYSQFGSLFKVADNYDATGDGLPDELMQAYYYFGPNAFYTAGTVETKDYDAAARTVTLGGSCLFRSVSHPSPAACHFTAVLKKDNSAMQQYYKVAVVEDGTGHVYLDTPWVHAPILWWSLD